MEKYNDRVLLLGKMYHQFYDDIINQNFTEKEWEEFNSNKSKVYQTLGIERKTFYIDDRGSKWIEPIDTDQQDEDWNTFYKKFTDEFEGIVIKWMKRKKEQGWSEFIEYLTIRSDEFIRDIKFYYDFRRSEDDEGEDDDDDYYEELMGLSDPHDDPFEDDDNELEGLIEDKPIDTGTDGDPDPSIEDILRDLRGEVEDERRELLNGEQVNGEQQ
jgi:hypothetical protein